MMYRLFVNADGADVHRLLAALKILGKIEVRNGKDTKKTIRNRKTTDYASSTLKSHAFLLLLSFIYKVNRIYTQEEIDKLEGDLGNLFGVLTEKLKLLREKLGREASDEIGLVMEELRTINHSLTGNIKRIGSSTKAAPCRALMHEIRQENHVIINTLIDEETIIDRVALEITPPKKSLLRKISDFILTFLGAAGTGGSGAVFGTSLLTALGLPLVGIVLTIAGVSILVGGGIAFLFKQSDDKRKEAFSDSHKNHIKDARIKEVSLIARNRQFMVQERETVLDSYNIQQFEQNLKMQQELYSLSEKHQGEIKELKEQFKLEKTQLESSLDRAQKTISSQQATLRITTDISSELKAYLGRIAEYMKHIKLSSNAAFQAMDESDLANQENLLPNLTPIPSENNSLPEEVKSDPSLLNAKQVEKDVRTLSARLKRSGAFSNGINFFQSDQGICESPQKTVAVRLNFGSPAEEE